MERIQFVGACNPPTDPGRNPLSSRFLRHVPVIYVDYPGETSLVQIYGTFVRAMLRTTTQLQGNDVPLTDAIVDFYQQSQVFCIFLLNTYCLKTYLTFRSISRKTSNLIMFIHPVN